jgi:2-oxoisovalerate dehydrogenase E2 component (dihydrolipoyl transacylase)
MPDFLLPDLGEGLTDAEIVNWLVAVGDEVTIDQPIVEVETAKATVEVPVPFAGTVSAVFGAPGERILVGSPLITVAAASSAAVSSEAVSDATPTSTGAAAAAVSSEYSGNVLIGYGTSAAPHRRRRGPARQLSQSNGAASVDVATPAVAKSTLGRAVSVISPVVRKLAHDNGVDLGGLAATDPSGVIRRSDVELAIAASATATANAPALKDQTPSGRVERIPLTGLRKVVADKLSQSRREIPEATVWVDVDATGLLDARRALNAAQPDQPISVLALLARFCVLGLTRYRELNSRIADDAIEILPAINLGFAAQTAKGLMVPVLHEAQAMTTRELASALSERTEAARTGTLRPAELTGGTFTVNNYGVFGVDGSAAIINHPEVAILGIGRIMDRPWVVDGQLAVRKVTELTLAFDHRACDGGVAGGFLRYVADCVENPLIALGDL